MKKIMPFMLLMSLMFLMISCDETKDEVPTKTSMEGVWTVSQAVDLTTGEDVTNKVNFPVSAFQLSSDGTIISTSSPLIMYIVYGNNKYTEISSKIDQVFNYSSLDFNGGEFFIGGGVTSRFTLEMKLEGLPGQKTLTEILGLLGIGRDYLDVVVYHKFKDVKVDFSEDLETMEWTFDEATSAEYNTKDNYGQYVLWGGWDVKKFSKVKITLKKQVKDLKEIIQSASQN